MDHEHDSNPDPRWDAQLDSRLAELPRGVPPRRDLWPELRQRIEQERDLAHGDDGLDDGSPHRTPQWWALAALLAMAMVSVLWFDVTAPQGTVFPSDLEVARAEYLELRGPLLAELEVQQGEASELAQSIAADLATVDAAVAEVEIAVAENAGDRRLKLMLADRYRQQANLIRRLQRLTVNDRSNT